MSVVTFERCIILKLGLCLIALPQILFYGNFMNIYGKLDSNDMALPGGTAKK